MNLLWRLSVTTAWATVLAKQVQRGDWLTLCLLLVLCVLYLHTARNDTLRGRAIHGLWQDALIDELPPEQIELVNKRFNVLRGAYNESNRGFFRVRS